MEPDPLAEARELADITQVHMARRGRRALKGAVLRIGRVATYPQSKVNANLIDVVTDLTRQRDELAATLEQFRGEVRAAIDEVPTSADLRAVAAEQVAFVRAVQRLSGDVDALARRLEEIEAVVPSLARRLDQAEVTVLPAGHGISPAVTELYLALEDAFRGPEEEIRDRLEPYLKDVGDGVGPLVDLGCGRGELLDLCVAAGVDAYGVELSPANIERCRAKGHQVVAADAVAHLRTLPDGSIGAVTAIHVAEHLEPEALVELVHEAHRVLEPSGVLVLETPNPENVRVGAGTFWLDPTHVRPVHPAYLEFLGRHVGFAEIEVRRLDRGDLAVAVPDGPLDPVIARLVEVVNQQFGAAVDVALVCRR